MKLQKNKPKIPTEAQDQERLVLWMNLNKVLFAAVPNENSTSWTNRKSAMLAEVKARKLGKSKRLSIHSFLKKGV